MADRVKNAELIRSVLDGGQLQFAHGKGWIDAGGDPQAWMTLLTLADTRNAKYRIKPGSMPDGVVGAPGMPGRDGGQQG